MPNTCLQSTPAFPVVLGISCSSGNLPHLTPTLPLRILLILCNAFDHLSEYSSTSTDSLSTSLVLSFNLASLQLACVFFKSVPWKKGAVFNLKVIQQWR